MKIEFTIGWEWVEVLCHFMAAFLYISTGYEVATSGRGFGLFTLLSAIALTCFGASL